MMVASLFQASAIALLATVLAAEPRDSADAFHTRLKVLRSQEVSFERTRALMKEHEQLIAEFPNHQDVGEAMHDLARLQDGFRNEEQTPIGTSQEEAIKWYRAARAETKMGSEIWINAGFDLARCLRARQDDKSIREARGIVEFLADRYRERFDVVTRAQAELVAQCIAEEDYETADTLCRELLNDSGRNDAQPLSVSEQSMLDGCQLKASVTLMQAMLFRPGTRAAKQDWFEGFVALGQSNSALKVQIAHYETRLAQIDQMMPDFSPPESTIGTPRKLLLAANVVAVVVLGIIAVQRRRNRQP